MQAAQVIPFSFESHEVRTLLINNEPWFVAADVCASLSIGNVSLAVNGRADRKNDGLDDDEKGIATVNTPFGDQQMLIVSESGLYALIFKSRKKEAKHFQKWVTAEVLPAIRKHGRYEDNHRQMDSLLGQTIGTDGLTVLSNLVAGKVNHLTRQNQRRATMKLWAQVQAAFNVRSVEDLPADQLNEARTFIAAYVLEGEYLGKEETPEEKHTIHRNVLRLRYNDRPFRCVVEGAQLWFVTADVGNALYLGDAAQINRFLTPEQCGHRWLGRQRLNVMSKSGLERAMLQAELKWTLTFRRWLDGVLAQASGASTAAPAKTIGLSHEQQSLLRDLVKNRIQALPQQAQGKAAQKCWAALKSRFNTPNYKAIAPEQFSEAVSLIARLPLEGELLPATKTLDLHYPISDWQAKSPELFRQDDPKSPDLLVNFHDLGKSAYSPCLELLDKLAEAGYCIDGAFYEFRSYQNQKFHADSMLHTLSYNVRRLLDDVERRRGYPQEYPKVKKPRC